MSTYLVCKHLIPLVFCVLTVVLTVQPETISLTLKESYGVLNNVYKSSVRFKSCVCSSSTPCTLPKSNPNQIQNTINDYQSISLQSNAFGESIYVYVCNIIPDAVTCRNERSKIEACTPDCSVKINIDCSGNGSQTLIWDRTDQSKPTLVNYTGVDLFSCCSSSTTIQHTTMARPMSNTNTRTQTTTSSTTLFTTDDSTAASPDTYKTSFYSSVDTSTVTSSTGQHGAKEQIRNDSDTLISPTVIGIIVGTAVGAILLTVAIMCLVWRIKTRRRNRADNKRAASVSTVQPGNETNIMAHSSREQATENTRQPQKNVAHVLPIVPEGQTQHYYNAVTDNYTYIDIRTSERLPIDKSSKVEGNVTAIEIRTSSPNRDIAQNTSKSTTDSNRNPGASQVSDKPDVYSKLHETQKVVFENPYDLGIENIDSRSTTSTRGVNNNHSSPLQAPPLNVDTSNKGEDARAPNQSNILEVIDVCPLTYTEVTPINSTNQLQDFRDTNGKKSLEILDSSRVTYAEIRPKKNKDVNLSEISQSSRDIQEDNTMPDRNTQNIQEVYSNLVSPNPVLSESYRVLAYENVLKDEGMSPTDAVESFSTSMLPDKAPVVNLSGDITYANMV